VFTTLLTKDHQLVAKVEYKDDAVIIETDDPDVLEKLQTIYADQMSVVDFVRANYRLNRLRAEGVIWELRMSSECN
jgi:hypothetical protein